jgi:3-oxoacyl-[acyl-carrier protein] reductase
VPVALVTGASRGIGAACARRLAVEGYDVCVTYGADAAGAQETAEAVRAAGRRAAVVAGSQAETRDGARIVSACSEALGPPGAVVANAGLTRDGLAVRMSGEDWRAPLETNLLGTAGVLDAAIGSMERSGAGGAIVVMSSVVGRLGNAGQANYAASKAALLGLVRELARTHGPSGIRVNAVAPGFVVTRLTDVLADDLREELRARTALARLGEPDDVVGPVAYLCSPDAGFVTGTVLAVDGGLSL